MSHHLDDAAIAAAESRADEDEHHRRMEREYHDEVTRDAFRSIVHYFGPAECLRLLATCVEQRDKPDADEAF